MSIEMTLSGLLFYIVIGTNIASNFYGYETYSKIDAVVTLTKINTNEQRFKTAFVLIVVEHFALILLAVMLFMAFYAYNVILAISWLVFRSIESLMQIYNKRTYWKLLGLSQDYLSADESQKGKIMNHGNTILESKNTNFNISQIFFSLGTISYSILFVTIATVPNLLGWFGIIAGLIYLIGNGLEYLNKNSMLVWSVGGLFILIFELILGGWLIFFS